MADITGTIAQNLQNIRKERGLTLQDLADLTGVSKSMLGEIERDASNPTITVLWKISTGLRVPISELIHKGTTEYVVVHQEDWQRIPDASFKIDMIYECGHQQNFEIYHMEFQPGDCHANRIHLKGVVEYVMVYEGTMTIVVNENVYTLEKGDSFTFEGQYEHTYRNDGAVTVKAYSVIHYT